MVVERRQLRIEGELEQQDWDSLLTFLGDVGLDIEPIHPAILDEGSEWNIPHDRLLNRQDFYEVAELTGATRSKAGQSWNCVTKLYDLKVNPIRYGARNFGYHQEDYAHIELEFDQPEKPRTELESKVFRNRLTDLHADSLAKFVTRATKEVGDYGEASASMVLGRGNGIGTLRFLRDVVQSVDVAAEAAEASD